MNGPQAMPAAPGVRGPRSLVLAIAWFAVAGCIYAVQALPHLDIVALGGVMAGVLIAYLATRHRTGSFDFFDPFLPFSVIYFLYFPVGALWCRARPDQMPSLSLAPYLAPAVGVATLGYVAFSLGYVVSFRRVLPHAPLAPARTACFWIPIGLGYAGQLAGVLQGRFMVARGGISPVLSAVQQLGSMFFLGWALLWYEYFSGRLTKTQRFQLGAVCIPMVASVLALTVGGKALAIMMIGLPAVAYWYVRRRLPWRSLAVVGLLGVFLVFPIYNTYRVQTRKADTGERFTRALTVASEWDARTYYMNSVESFMGRMAVVTSMAAVLRDVPASVRYQRGETLLLLPVSLFIPRVLWPDKPNIMTGREFGVTFQLVGGIDRETLIAPTVVADLYWNFSVPGVLFGMFLLGAAYRWCYQRYGASRDYDPIGKAIWLSILVSLMFFESNVAGLVSLVIKSLTIAIVLQWFLESVGLAARLRAA